MVGADGGACAQRTVPFPGAHGSPAAWLLGLMQLMLTAPRTKESRADHCVKVPERSLSHVVGGKVLFHGCAGSGTNKF